MRSICIAIFCLACTTILKAQTYKVQWGEEMKLKKGSMDFEILQADETGVYVLEGKMKMKSYFVIGATYGISNKLIKFDKNFNEVYDQDYNKLLKGLNFKSIQFLQKEMYLFASDYSKKEKTYSVLGLRLDRKTGEPLGEFKELATFTLDSKKDDFEYSFTPTRDSTQWMLVGDVSTETSSSISITVFDKMLTKKSATPINLAFEPKSYTLEDIIQTNDGKFLIMGKQYEYVPTGKKNKTIRTFTKYAFAKYDSKGKKEFDLPTDVSSHYATSGRTIYSSNGELALTGFYSNDPKKSEVNGVYFHKIDVNTGSVLHSSYKEVSANMLDQASDDENEEEESKKEKKEKEKAKEKDGDEDGISKDFVIRGVEYNPVTGATLLIAEFSKYTSYTSTHYDSYTKKWNTRTTHTFTNSDLMVIYASKDGTIEWINTLPKKQVEIISGSGPGLGGSLSSDLSGFFARGGGMPFYSSFTYMGQGNKLIFLFNDHQNNTNVKKLGDKVTSITNFKKSVAYAVSLDLSTGTYTRKVLLSNEDDPVLMPRFGFVVGKDFYLSAMKMKALGKSDFKMGKVAVKSL